MNLKTKKTISEIISSDEFKLLCKKNNIKPIAIMVSGSSLFELEFDTSDIDLIIVVNVDDFIKIKAKHYKYTTANNITVDIFINTLSCIRLNNNSTRLSTALLFLLCAMIRKLSAEDFVYVENKEELNKLLLTFNSDATINFYKKLLMENLTIVFDMQNMLINKTIKIQDIKHIYLILYLYALLTNQLEDCLQKITNIKKISSANNSDCLAQYNDFILTAIDYLYKWLGANDYVK